MIRCLLIRGGKHDRLPLTPEIYNLTCICIVVLTVQTPVWSEEPNLRVRPKSDAPFHTASISAYIAAQYAYVPQRLGLCDKVSIHNLKTVPQSKIWQTITTILLTWGASAIHRHNGNKRVKPAQLLDNLLFDTGLCGRLRSASPSSS